LAAQGFFFLLFFSFPFFFSCLRRNTQETLTKSDTGTPEASPGTVIRYLRAIEPDVGNEDEHLAGDRRVLLPSFQRRLQAEGAAHRLISLIAATGWLTQRECQGSTQSTLRVAFQEMPTAPGTLTYVLESMKLEPRKSKPSASAMDSSRSSSGGKAMVSACKSIREVHVEVAAISQAQMCISLCPVLCQHLCRIEVANKIRKNIILALVVSIIAT